MKPAIGACTESAMSAARASSPKPRRELVAHPEAALEVDLARREAVARASAAIAASGLSRDGTRAGPKWSFRAIAANLDGRPSERALYARAMSERPTRIDLLELDIDLRLTDLWREAAGIEEWSLEVVSAFMRAAYGKGYCDALTEELPGRALRRPRLPRSRAPPAGARRRLSGSRDRATSRRIARSGG